MRVHELARELQIETKDIMPLLKELGIEAKTHSSGLLDYQVDEVRRRVRAGRGGKDASAAKGHEPVKEVVKIDETSGQRLTERRIGGTVIRRRKKADAEPEATEALAEDTLAASAEHETPADNQQLTAGAGTQGLELESQEPGLSGEPAAADLQEAGESLDQKITIKKPNFKGKESQPATILGRINLKPRPVREPEQPARPAEPAQPVVVIPLLQPEAATRKPTAEEEAREREKRAKDPTKDKSKRQKFRWQQETLSEEVIDETDHGAAQHRRVRYKVKDKPPVRVRRKGEAAPAAKKGTELTVPKAIKRKIRVQNGITVGELAKRMGVKASELMKKLIALGIMATINQMLDIDTAALVATDFNYEIETVANEVETMFDEQIQDADENQQHRCPVVTVMGHVDHGKTSLLDTIRNTNVAEGEKGGITQHIGAYKVSTPHGDIAFVDTPGHEAFTSMRARGAQVTDIVILVVAAEEGPKPQTIEALNHARAAQVPIIVAINKIDKPDANPEKVRQELSNYGLLSEDWGGDTIFVEVSAKKNLNIDKLLEMVLLQAEMLELRANPNKPAKGSIIEARLDKGRGPIATVLVQEGTLRVGDSFASKQHFGKVRALIDDHGRTMKEAGPSTPVEIIGFSAVPEAGDIFLVVDEKKARETSDYWQMKRRDEDLRKDARISLENFMSSIAEADTKTLRIVLKADVQGSFEALKQSLESLSTDEVKVQIIHSNVGAISQNDVMLAAASRAIIIGFNVKTETKVTETAEQEKVDVRNYQIIYDVVDEVKRAMTGMLAPKFIEKSSGKAEVRQVFEISKLGTIAGCYVSEGRIVSRSKGRVLRDGEVVCEADISSLKRFKEDVREAVAGQDCGIALGAFKEYQVGDIIESFIVEELERKL
jgi:translation initiation factor IF-2